MLHDSASWSTAGSAELEVRQHLKHRYRRELLPADTHWYPFEVTGKEGGTADEGEGVRREHVPTLRSERRANNN